MLRDLLKEGGLYTVANFLAKGISLLLLPLYTSYFTTADYGVIEILTVFGGFINAILTFQVYQGVSRYLADPQLNKTQSIRIASTGLFFILLVYAVGGLFLMLYNDFFINILSSETKIQENTFNLAILSVISGGIFYSLGIKLRYLRRTLMYTITTFIHSISIILITIYLVVYNNYGIEAIYLGTIFASPILILVQVYSLRKDLGWYFGVVELKKLLRFSTPLIPAALAYLTLNFTDRIFIKEYLDFNELGIYGVASKFGSIISIIILGFSSALTPIIYGNHDKQTTKIHIKDFFFTFFALGTLGVLVLSIFSFETVEVFTNERYQDAYFVMPFFYVTMLVTGLSMFSIGLHIKEKTKIISYIVLISSSINIILNILLIPEYGLMGAAFATMISVCINNFTIYYFSNKNYRLPIRFLLIIPSLLVFLILIIFGSYILPLIMDYGIFSIIIKIGIIVLYFMVLFYSGVWDRERLNLKKILNIRKSE